MEFTPPAQQKALRDQIAFIKQFELETFDDYYERFLRLLRLCPNNGFPEYIRIGFLLDGMTPYERCMVDIMAGGSIIDCTLRVMWDIFDARADATTLRASSKSASLKPEDVTQNVRLQEESIQQSDHTVDRLLGPESEPPQFCLDNNGVVEAISDSGDVLDETLQVVLTICDEDFQAESEDFISSHCSDVIALDNEVSHIIDSSPVTNIIPSSHVQEQLIEKALGKKVVRGTLEKVDIQYPLIKNCMVSNSEELFEEVCINWKKRKKEKRVQSTIGWRLGWNFSGVIYGAIRKHARGHWQKFDGVHPWAPNE